MNPGMVYLVGSGPGSRDLLTLRAVEILAIADVVVYDKLANLNFVPFVKSGVELIDVGKQSSMHTMAQGDINLTLVELSRQGKCVVRLKGGDPYVFGRGGEEAEVLVAHQIPFEVVSGVTSSIAVPAAAGIPVTHRDHCTSFHVITGHERAEREESALDFATLARLDGTLVFMMGVRNLERICMQLVAHGKSASTTVALVERGCTSRQRQVIGTLENIVAIAKEAKIGAPAVTVVGSVVQLSRILHRIPIAKPLSGKRILVSRTRRQVGRLASLLKAQGADVLEIPLIRIEPIQSMELWDSIAQSLANANWLVFTSENGVEAFLESARIHGFDLRKLYAVRIVAVGSSTASKLSEAGIIADLVPPVYTAEALVDCMGSQIHSGDRVVLARAKVATPIVVETLIAQGIHVDDFAIYETLPETTFHGILKDNLESKDLDWLTFASSSAVESFCEALGGTKVPDSIRIASIGPMTSATLQKNGLEVHAEATVHNLQGLVDAIQIFERGDRR